MPAAWDDDRHRAEDGYDAPLGADAGFPSEELDHELALAAALDRSRPSLSPDAQTSARMRRRLFEAMAEEGFGRMELGKAPIRPSAPAPGPAELTAPLGAPIPGPDMSGPQTRPVGPPVPDLEPDVPAASVTRSAGEHTLSADSTASTGPETRTRRRGRHVLPTDHPDHPEQDEPAGRDRSRPSDGRPSSRPSGRRRPRLRGRFGVVVSCVAALAVLAGIAATASRNALPGDALYGVKRATEATGEIFTFSDQAEATRQLGLAKTRVDEVQGLLQQGTAPDSEAIAEAMRDFDTATANGSRLTLSADRSANGSELADLRTWTTAQQDRMNELKASVPSANEPDTANSLALLDRILNRTEALRSRTGCVEDGTASVDDLGPLPSSEPCTQDPARAGTGDPSQTGDEDGTTSGTESGDPSSSEPGSTTGGPTSGESTENRGGLPLVGDPNRLPSDVPGLPSGSTGPTSTTDTPAPLLPPITLPPLLPGLGPVTIG